MLLWASGSSLWRTEGIKVADAKLLFPKVYHFIFREASTFPGLVFKGPSHLLGSSFRWFKLFQCSVTCKCFIFSFLHMDFECICLSVCPLPLSCLFTGYSLSFILSNQVNFLWLWCLSLLYLSRHTIFFTTAGWLWIDLLMTVWFNWLIVPEELKLSGSCFSFWQAWYLTLRIDLDWSAFQGLMSGSLFYWHLISRHSFLALVACWNQRELWQKAGADARDCEVTPICRFHVMSTGAQVTTVSAYLTHTMEGIMCICSLTLFSPVNS